MYSASTKEKTVAVLAFISIYSIIQVRKAINVHLPCHINCSSIHPSLESQSSLWRQPRAKMGLRPTQEWKEGEGSSSQASREATGLHWCLGWRHQQSQIPVPVVFVRWGLAALVDLNPSFIFCSWRWRMSEFLHLGVRSEQHEELLVETFLFVAVTSGTCWTSTQKELQLEIYK